MYKRQAFGVAGKYKYDGVDEKDDVFGDDGWKRFDAGLGVGVFPRNSRVGLFLWLRLQEL